MPELPEVETIKRILEGQLKNQKICSVEIKNPQIIAHPSENEFIKLLTGRKINSMGRRGKFLIINLENNDRIILHLRMTGQLLVAPKNYEVEKHTHLIAKLSGGNEVRYIDVRRFGRFWYLMKNEKDDFTGIAKLGAEPCDKNLTAEYLKEKLSHKKKTIKELLLDQSIVAGIGNIYSDEILFAAKIFPGKSGLNLCDEDYEKLSQKIPEIIKWGIEANKMSAEEYFSGKGKDYRNMPLLKIYGREGKACINCGTAIEKVTLGGRSSCFCPECQKKN